MVMRCVRCRRDKIAGKEVFYCAVPITAVCIVVALCCADMLAHPRIVLARITHYIRVTIILAHLRATKAVRFICAEAIDNRGKDVRGLYACIGA